MTEARVCGHLEQLKIIPVRKAVLSIERKNDATL